MVGFSTAQPKLCLTGNPSDRDPWDVAEHVGHLADLPPVEDLLVEDGDRSADPVERHGIGGAVPGDDDRGVGCLWIGSGIDGLSERWSRQKHGRQKRQVNVFHENEFPGRRATWPERPHECGRRDC